MDVYRFFPWNKSSRHEDYGGALDVPPQKKRSGRHDIPDSEGGLYFSQLPIGAIAEAVQPFRGLPFNDKRLKLTNKEFRKADGLPLALVTLEINEKARLVNLDELDVLQEYKIKPSEISSDDRKITQQTARTLYDAGVDGFAWHSSLDPSWTNLTLRSEEHTSELQSLTNLVCRLLLEKK